MVLHVFISLLGGVPLCIPYGLYSGTSLGGTTRGTLEGYPGRVLSVIMSHYDALALTLCINYFDVHQVFADPGSAANLLQLPAFN